jgi:hypothetical protein
MLGHMAILQCVQPEDGRFCNARWQGDGGFPLHSVPIFGIGLASYGHPEGAAMTLLIFESSAKILVSARQMRLGTRPSNRVYSALFLPMWKGSREKSCLAFKRSLPALC